MYLNLCFSPQPIFTIWDIWLNAANYYCHNSQKIKNVAKFNPTTSISI